MDLSADPVSGPQSDICKPGCKNQMSTGISNSLYWARLTRIANSDLGASGPDEERAHVRDRQNLGRYATVCEVAACQLSPQKPVSS